MKLSHHEVKCNMLKVLIWATFMLLILQKHTTEQKSLHNPVHYEKNNNAKTRTPEKHWPTYYRRVPATNDDDEVDINIESDMMIKTLMEELVAKSRLVDIVAHPVMENDETRLKVTTNNAKLESQPEILEKVMLNKLKIDPHDDDTNGEKAKKEENFTYKTKQVEKKTMNEIKEEKYKKTESKAFNKVAIKTSIPTDNEIKNEKDMTMNLDPSQDLKLKTYHLVGKNDGNNTKVMPDETMLGTLESTDTTATIFNELKPQKDEKFSQNNNQNKIEENILTSQSDNQTTMESLKELIKVVNGEHFMSKNVMSSKQLEDTHVNRTLLESTESIEDIVVHDLKEKIANQTTIESLKELKPVLNEKNSGKLTHHTNFNSVNSSHIEELKDTQNNKPLLDLKENCVQNKTDDKANNDAHIKEPQVVKFINFTIATDNTNILQAEKIIATKQNDVVLKIQLDDLQEKAPEIKKIVKINEEPVEIDSEKKEKDNTKVQPPKVFNENQKIENEKSILQKEALEDPKLGQKQSLSNTTKSSNENSLKNKVKICLDTEKDISKYDLLDSGPSMVKTNNISLKSEGNLMTSLKDLELKENFENVSVAITDNNFEESNMTERHTPTTIEHTLEETNSFVQKNRLEEEANTTTSKEVFAPTTEASIEHVLEEPNYMINTNNLDEATTMPSIVFSAYTTEESLENALGPTNFSVKKNDLEEEATVTQSKIFSKSEAVMDLTKTQELGTKNEEEKLFNASKPIGDTIAQLSMERTTEKNPQDTAKDENILTLAETQTGEHKTLSFTKSDDSDDKMKMNQTVQKKPPTENFMQQLKIKPLPENSSYEEMMINTNTKDTEFSIVADDTEHKLSITSTEIFNENSISISEYVSKFLEALKPAIRHYDNKKSNTTKHVTTQTAQIIKDPIKMEFHQLPNTAQTNSDEYNNIESYKVESSEVAGNDVGEEPFKILSSIVESSIEDEELNGESMQHTIKDIAEPNSTKLEILQKPKPKEKFEENKSTETAIESTTNGDSLSYNKINNSNKTVAEEINIQDLEELRDVIKMVLEETPYEVDNFLEKPITPEITIADNKNTETSFSLDSFNNNKNQISNYAEEKDNKNQMKEVSITGNNNIKTALSSDEKLEASFVDNKNQISINTMNKKITKNDEEFNGPLIMVLDEIPMVETITEKTSKGNKNMELPLSLQQELEKYSVPNENQISNKTVEKKNRRNDEQVGNEKESSTQVAKFENSMKTANLDSLGAGGRIEYIELSNKTTQVKNITSFISTTVPPTFNVNKENNILEKPIQSQLPIIGVTNNQNYVQKKKTPENLLNKTIKASVDNDNDERTKQPNNDNYNKILPMTKRTKITKLNEDVTATITCITRFKADADKKNRQAIKNNDFKNLENNAKLTPAAAFNDNSVVNDGDDGDSFKQQQNDELSPELKLVTWQTYTDNKFKVHQTEELTGKKQQTVESIADNDDEAYNDAYVEVADNNDADDDDDDDGGDYYDEDVAHDVEGSSELSKESVNKINDDQNENIYRNSEKFSLVATEQVDSNNHQSTTNEDKHKTAVSDNVDGQVVIQEQLNDVDTLTNRPHLSSSIKHYRIDDNAYGNRKNKLDQVEQLEWQYPDITQYNAKENIFSEAHELPPTKTKSATPTTTNWWNTLPYEEIRKFLNTIFYGTADDIYREIARRAKEAQMREAKKVKEDQRSAKESWKQSNEWSLL